MTLPDGPGPGGDGSVPPSIAAIMAAIRAEVAAPPAPAAANDEADDAGDGIEADYGHDVPTVRATAAQPGQDAPVAVEPDAEAPLLLAESAPEVDAGTATVTAGGLAPDPADRPSDRVAVATAHDVVTASAFAPAPVTPGRCVPDPADVRAALAPLLKDWLDAHLPEIVEAAVHAEIRRLTGAA